MIIVIIRKGDRIMIGMSIGGMIVMIQAMTKINNMIIAKIGIGISHHLGITIVNNIEEIVIRINKIDQTTKNSISQKH